MSATAPQAHDRAVAYPPAPWTLCGQSHASVFAVPASALPATPEGFRPLTLLGRGFVVAGWVDYQEGSVLQYGELFAAVVGFFGGRPTITVTHMWVDSEPSMHGGRELWGYPKELAEFDLGDERGSATGLARGTFRALAVLPFRIGGKSATVQPLDGQATFIKARMSAKLVLETATFAPDPDGPLAFLRGARRLISVGQRDFRATFGV